MKKVFSVLSLIILISFLVSANAQSQTWNSNEGYMGNNFTSTLNVNQFPVNLKTNNSEHYKLSTVMQDTTLIYRIITLDGNEFIGTIVEQDAQQIVLKTERFGIITIQKDNLRSINLIESEIIKDGTYWADHMQSTRHFWSPNGYGLKKGEAYYQNVWIFFNQFSVGVTDNILIGGGLIPLFFFAGTATPMWITPKVSFPIVKDKVNVGAGGLFATVLGEDDTNLGILYGTSTFGPRDKNLTVGIGYGYANGQWADKPTFSLSFLSRVGRKGYFISENYLISNDNGYLFIGMIGGRTILGSSNVGLDYGLVIPIYSTQANFWAVPWLGVTVPLGKKGRR
jgi:hypothetical protein